MTQNAISALGSLAVVASESVQHQTPAEIMRTPAVPLAGLPPELKARIEDVALRSLSALGEHVLTRELGGASRQAGFAPSAEAMEQATAKIGQSIGRLNSRSTRVPQIG